MTAVRPNLICGKRRGTLELIQDNKEKRGEKGRLDIHHNFADIHLDGTWYSTFISQEMYIQHFLDCVTYVNYTVC